MATIRVWDGWRAVHGNRDVSRFVWLEFEGEHLGTLRCLSDGKPTDRSFYRTTDGQVVVAEHRYGDWEVGDYDIGVVEVYNTLDRAAFYYRNDLVRIGAYDAPSRELNDWLRRVEEEE